MKTATELIHAGAPGPEWGGPLTPPIYETTTFVFASAAEVVAYNEGRSSKYLYSRYGNPTLTSVERQVAALDQAEAALVFSSGMGAITTILMGHARGAVCLSAGTHRIPLASIASTHVKKTVTGHGHAGKEQIQRMVQHALGLKTAPEPPDVADALAVAIAYASQNKRTGK